MNLLLNSLYELGKLWIEKENLETIDVLLDVEKLKRRTKKVILVELDEVSENNFIFNKVSPKDYNPKDNAKYLYKSGSSRGTDITPSCLITELDKTFNNKFFKWFEQNNDDDFLKGILNCLENSKDIIFKDIETLFNGFGSSDNKNVILTLVINKGDQQNFLGDYSIFKESLKNKSFEKYYFIKSGKKNIKGEGLCFLCDEEKEVFGLVSNSIGFAFSTPDKRGNVPDFNINNQWKQLPICGDCALYLEAGKKFVEKYMSFSKFGLNYYIIPNFIFGSTESFDKLFRIIKRFEDTKDSDEVVIKEDKLNKIVEDFEDILEFKFLFYQSSNSAFNILAYVESILPSWMGNIYRSQQKIIDFKIFSEDYMKSVISKDAEGNFINICNKNEKYYPVSQQNWYLGFLRGFFSAYSFKNYLEVVSSILSSKKIDFDFLLSRVMDDIRKNWRNQNDYLIKINTFKSLALILLFSDLDLFKESKFMIKNNGELTEELINDILDTPDKKATFLLGALTRRVTYVQYKELGSSPFVNKLWGLSLDQKKIKKLYPMVLNKLREYDKAVPDLEENISLNLLNSEKNWKLTRDETSYYFVLGYTLSFNITKDEENDEDGNN